MKKRLIILILILNSLNISAQHFLDTFNKEHYDLWGTANLIDAFGDESNNTVFTFVTNGEYQDNYNNIEKIKVVVLVDYNENFLSIDLYNQNNEIYKKINFNGLTLMKDMASGEIFEYFFSQKDWCSLLSPITTDENRANPIKLILDQNGQNIKFKIKKLSWGTDTIVGEFNFTIKAWSNYERKVFIKK